MSHPSNTKLLFLSDCPVWTPYVSTNVPGGGIQCRLPHGMLPFDGQKLRTGYRGYVVCGCYNLRLGMVIIIIKPLVLTIYS